MGALLRPYRGAIALLLLLGLLGNLTSLILPGLIGQGINAYTEVHALPAGLVREFALASGAIVVFTYLQILVQVLASERVARDLRWQLAEKISRQTAAFVTEHEPSRLLTNLTSDVDSVKLFVAQAIPSLMSSTVVLLGASVLLLRLNWKLGLTVLSIVPMIGLFFMMVLRRVRPIFQATREAIDRLNKVITQNILGAALVRVLDARAAESEKFSQANQNSRNLGLRILANFAMMIPAVTFVGNLAALSVLTLGGRLVLQGELELGDLAAFLSYLAILIFPIFVIGFMSNVISQAQASYKRLARILDAPDPPPPGGLTAALVGEVEVRQLSLSLGERRVLDDITLRLKPGTRNAILGPTAAGKTQLLYVLAGLVRPSSGEVLYDGRKLAEYSEDSLHRQVALVFQESILFHMTLRENVAFRKDVLPEDWQKALATAELTEFVDSLPQGLDTIVSERGTSLSGGQKQRVMLARALATNPRVLLLDDFTARLDPETEARVLSNLRTNYPDLTLLAVSQRIATVKDYDNISLLMEGQLLAQGTHAELLESSPEYMQIYESQQSTMAYE